jgi:hypothetical protein
MLRVPEFRALVLRLARGAPVVHVSLAQFSSDWLTEPSLVDLRRRIDDALLRRLIVMPRSINVQRVVLYDLAGRGRPSSPDDLHEQWMNRLRRDVSYLGAERPDGDVRYTVRQLVLAREGPKSRPPDDYVAHDGASVRPFDDIWQREELIPLLIPETRVVGPHPDEDPLWYLDLNVRDTDRLSFGDRRRQAVDEPSRRWFMKAPTGRGRSPVNPEPREGPEARGPRP